MAKAKKGKGKKKKVKEEDPNALTEVDKTFYELTIADLNRKLARLRSLTQELELKTEELHQDLDKNEEDKSDIITFLKRMLQEKTCEVSELEERITAMQETRQTETEQFEMKIAKMEQEFKQMHEQLTSENKLLEGKLSSLEEFRSQRDELMRKFYNQEKKMESQEKRHQSEMYKIERKFIISKDKLKKDVEARLLQLSTEFHDASELRIAATTHRVIRENITVNNEFDNMLQIHQKLYRDFCSLKTKGIVLRQEAKLHEAEKNKCLSKVLAQVKIIEEITKKNECLIKELGRYKKYEAEIGEARESIKKDQDVIVNLEYKVRLLEQNLHKIKCDNYALETEVSHLKFENERLDDILMEGVSCIKETLMIPTGSATSIRSSRRESMLNTLFSLLSKGHERRMKKLSLETVSSADSIYALGDLGFVPKPADPRSTAQTCRNMSSQVGASFEEFLLHGPTIEANKGEFLFNKRESPRDETEEESGAYDPFAEEEEEELERSWGDDNAESSIDEAAKDDAAKSEVAKPEATERGDEKQIETQDGDSKG
ncbi:cilia- and flagella-associated protein 157 [Euwallacea similis]|uniref:cilia- and flagella-associated protein 157 n=1 Tax=Euwallacea similis TaxID=1736056 RepID=UPI00344EC125